MNMHSINIYVMMLIQANIHEHWQNACDMANHDVDDQRLQLINRDGQDGDPGKDRIYGQQQVLRLASDFFPNQVKIIGKCRRLTIDAHNEIMTAGERHNQY
jgi:hypothetical protein